MRLHYLENNKLNFFNLDVWEEMTKFEFKKIKRGKKRSWVEKTFRKGCSWLLIQIKIKTHLLNSYNLICYKRIKLYYTYYYLILLCTVKDFRSWMVKSFSHFKKKKKYQKYWKHSSSPILKVVFFLKEKTLLLNPQGIEQIKII